MSDMQLCRDHPDFRCDEVTTFKDQFTLAGKRALVTGAAGGIGRSTSRAFADLGADVTLMDIPQTEEKLEALCTEIKKDYGVNAYYVLGDVAEEASVKVFVEEAAKKMGGIDVLHNNAGIILRGETPDVDVAEWNRLMSINLTGMLLVGRTVANKMVQQGRGGAIINTASQSGMIYNKLESASYGYSYYTSKAGVIHLTHGMALNYCKHGIRVNCISPGVVLSGIHDPVPVDRMQFSLGEIPLGRFGKLKEIAGVVAFLATDMASFMIGSNVVVDGGQTLN